METVSCMTAQVQGIEAVPITINCYIDNGLPGITVIGLPDTKVIESIASIRAALKTSGYDVPNKNIVFHLQPNEIKKTGDQHTFAMAVALLAATQQINPESIANKVFYANLGLEGKLFYQNGTLAVQKLCNDLDLTSVIAPSPSSLVFDSGNHLHIAHLKQLKSNDLKNEVDIELKQPSRRTIEPDFKDISGNFFVKQSALIAAAGNHSLLMWGQNKELADNVGVRIASILPPLTQNELEEVELIADLVGTSLQDERTLRPIRCPHHSITLAGLVGGGNPIAPGEVTLAHKGVLYLDDITSMSENKLELIALSKKDACVHLARVGEDREMPCDFFLVAKAQPCACGGYGHGSCRCSPAQIAQYQERLSKTIGNKFDLAFNIDQSEQMSLETLPLVNSSQEMRDIVCETRAFNEHLSKNYKLEKSLSEAEELLLSNPDFLREQQHIKSTVLIARTIASINKSEAIETGYLNSASKIINPFKTPVSSAEIPALKEFTDAIWFINTSINENKVPFYEQSQER